MDQQNNDLCTGDSIYIDDNITPIQAFYQDSVVFLTGCTGFLGHLLIEKLLRCCPNIKKIFVLIRNKKEMDAPTRLRNIFKCVIFNKLKELNPHFQQKVVPIAGDCVLPELGISLKDRKMLINEVWITHPHLVSSIQTIPKIFTVLLFLY